MDGVQFGSIAGVTHYWNGAAVGTQEPLYRGWSMLQGRPVNTRVGGVQIDRSWVIADSKGATPTMIVRA